MILEIALGIVLGTVLLAVVIPLTIGLLLLLAVWCCIQLLAQHLIRAYWPQSKLL